ncbi:MAG: mandelate racemase/muconate lactonizing enzyme family protein [Pseudonocardia sp.]
MSSGTVITDVSTTFLSIPLEKPLVTAAFPIPAIDTALVRVHTADGHEGVAWSFAFGRGRIETVLRLVDDLAELARGADATRTEALWARMANAVGFIGRRGVAALAMSTIDTACWDIKGKAAGQPVHRLLGGARDRVEVYASQGLWLDRSREELAAEAQSLVEQGFPALKMRAGLPDPREDIARVRAVREAIGPDVTLMVDANQAWTLKRTVQMARAFEEFDLFWLEEPMPHSDLNAYAAARDAISIPLCTGESNYLKDEVLALARAGAADVVMPDLMRRGGVTEWVKAAHLCEAHGLPVTPHLFMEHSAHLACATPNSGWQEYQPWWQPIMANPVQIVDGAIVLPDEPGFGIHLDDAALEAFRP